MGSGERTAISDGPADTAQVAAFERDRRELIRRGLGLGGAVIAAPSIPLLLSVRNAFAASSADADIITAAIHLEQVAVLAYTTVLDGKLLTPGFAGIVRRFRDHEQAHVTVLTKALADLGGTTPPPPATAKDVDAVVKGLGDVRSQGDVARFAIELELAAIAAYYDAHRKLLDGKLLQTGASIMANEAQHLVVLRQAVKQDPVPNAFETGEK
jgi:rubrerythrin